MTGPGLEIALRQCHDIILNGGDEICYKVGYSLLSSSGKVKSTIYHLRVDEFLELLLHVRELREELDGV